MEEASGQPATHNTGMPDAERSLIFPAAEFRGRLERLQEALTLHDLDALLLTTPADVFYVTGFLTRFWESPARPWYVLVPRTGEPVAVIPSIGADLMGQTWVKDIRCWNAPDPSDSGMDLLADAVREKARPAGRLGVPMGLETHVRMPLADYHLLREKLHPMMIVDGTECLHSVRELKSEAEIEKLRDVCDLTARAFGRVPDCITPGMGLDAVFRRFQCLCLEEGADWVSYLAGASDKDGYRDVISPATPRPITEGDVLMLDTGAVRQGYFSDFDRNFAVGAPSDVVLRAQEALWLATEDVLHTLRPEQRACDVHKMLCDALQRYGATPCDGRFGHGLGVTLTEWPSLSAVDTTPLKAGMVLTLEPSVLLPEGKLMVHEENLVLREDGAELLSPRAPQDLPVLVPQ